MLTPASEREVSEIVADAAAKRMPLAVAGGGTRAGLGRPMQTSETLSTLGLSGVTLYEPSELVVSAKAGTPLAEVEALLAEQGQRLAFEPMDHRPLFGQPSDGGTPTVGAVAAANLSGPRRITAGAARDSLIGVRAVTGEGTAVKSGGRVMKNVAGYDLVKFLAGSFGSLAVLTEVTFKVLPVPETEATLLFAGLDDGRAVALLAAALGSPHAVTGAAHMSEPARTLVRIEGFGSSVEERIGRLASLLAAYGQPDVTRGSSSAELWKTFRDVEALAMPADVPVWRVSVKPSDGPGVVGQVRKSLDCRVVYDWGGGLIWLAGGEGSDAGAAAVRNAVAKVGGHATLVRAPDAVRNAVAVFQPLPEPLMVLTRKLKTAFDPAGILNPGRMYAGL